MIAGLQPWEVIFGHGRAQIISLKPAELEKLLRHHGAHRVETSVLRAGAAESIAVKSGRGGEAADLKRAIENVGAHSAIMPSTSDRESRSRISFFGTDGRSKRRVPHATRASAGAQNRHWQIIACLTHENIRKDHKENIFTERDLHRIRG